jgi:hypothetical protein
MDDRILQEVLQYQYFPFFLIDDDSKYYCKSYESGTVEGFTKFNDVVLVPEGKDAYNDFKRLPSQEIPIIRIKSISAIQVGLEFLRPR